MVQNYFFVSLISIYNLRETDIIVGVRAVESIKGIHSVTFREAYMKSVCFLCPPYVETGGTECIFECAATLKAMGVDATVALTTRLKNGHLTYLNDGNGVPQRFRRYPVSLTVPDVDFDGLVVFPETLVNSIPLTRFRNVGVWWLSVDNAFLSIELRKNIFLMGEQLRHNIRVHQTACSRSVVHLVQSRYAYEFCKKHFGIPLYLRDSVTASGLNNCDRDVSIAYNPRRGSQYVAPVIDMLSSSYKCVPIIGLQHFEVLDLLSRSKVCIDFGHQPGRDKLPREAGLAGCVVLLGRRGAASNEFDFPVGHRYKVDLDSPNYLNDSINLVEDIFKFYDDHLLNQKHFRDIVRNATSEHKSDCLQLISSISSI